MCVRERECVCVCEREGVCVYAREIEREREQQQQKFNTARTVNQSYSTFAPVVDCGIDSFTPVASWMDRILAPPFPIISERYLHR